MEVTISLLVGGRGRSVAISRKDGPFPHRGGPVFWKRFGYDYIQGDPFVHRPLLVLIAFQCYLELPGCLAASATFMPAEGYLG